MPHSTCQPASLSRPIITTDQLAEGQCKGFVWPDKTFFLVRHQGRARAYENRCPHLGVALEWIPDQFLDIDGQFIQCSTHGALFSIDDGLCISGPCRNQSLTPLDIAEVEGIISLLPVD